LLLQQIFVATMAPAIGETMGLYDEISLEVELPDREVPPDKWFQTKSFPWPNFSRYRITAAGRLVNESGRDLEPTGYIDFLADDDESPNGLVEYRAQFVDGALKSIVRISDPDDRIFGLESIRWFHPQRTT
jgi:hypothetical protein